MSPRCTRTSGGPARSLVASEAKLRELGVPARMDDDRRPGESLTCLKEGMVSDEVVLPRLVHISVAAAVTHSSDSATHFRLTKDGRKALLANSAWHSVFG